MKYCHYYTHLTKMMKMEIGEWQEVRSLYKEVLLSSNKKEMQLLNEKKKV